MARVVFGTVVWFLGAGLWSVGQAPDRPVPERSAIERGRYLVHAVAMCVECHTPRDERGAPIASRLLSGAPVPVDPPPYPELAWAVQAPNIAGLVGYSDEEELRLLTEGVARQGGPPRAPMPRYRMSREDARAVIAYLRSLPH